MLEKLGRENPAAAWEKVRELLRQRMAYGAYEQYLKPVRFHSLEGSQMTLIAADHFAAAWLTERATALTQSLVSGIFNRSDIQVRFRPAGENFSAADSSMTKAVQPFAEAQRPPAAAVPAQPPAENPEQAVKPGPPPIDAELQLAEARLSLRDLFIKQNREIPIPGYFRRWIPYLGPTLSWMVVAFRQIFYLHAGSHARPETPFPATSDEISRWSGTARSTFWENIKDPRLGWFVVQVPQNMRWKPDSATGQPRQKPNVYRFTASMPLTPGDARALLIWLGDHGVRTDPVKTLEQALQTQPGEIFPLAPPPPDADSLAQAPAPLSVQDVVMQAAGRLPRTRFAEVQKLADRLETHLIPRSDLIFVTWYFLHNWVPRLGSGPAWLVTLLRDRCFFARGDAPSRRTVRLHGGAGEAAAMLGLARPKTICEWLPPLSERPAWEGAVSCGDPQRARRKAATRDLMGRFLARRDGPAPGIWQFQVAPYGEEPLIEEHQAAYDYLLDWVGAYLENGERDELDALLAEMGAPHNGGRTRSGLSHPEGGRVSDLLPAGEGREPDADPICAGRVPDSFPPAEGRVSDSTLVAEGRESDSQNGNPGAFRTQEMARSGLILKQVLNTFTTTEALQATLKHLFESTSPPANPTAEKRFCDERVGEAGKWHLAVLLDRLKIGVKRKLIENRTDPKALVSLLCYVSAPEGAGIKDLRAYTAGKLLEDAQHGAGGIFDRLGNLPPARMAELLQRALAQPYTISATGERLFDEAFRGAERTRLLALADLLGVYIPPREAEIDEAEETDDE